MLYSIYQRCYLIFYLTSFSIIVTFQYVVNTQTSIWAKLNLRNIKESKVKQMGHMPPMVSGPRPKISLRSVFKAT